MKKIQIFGTGCAKCNKLTEKAEAAAKANNVDYQLEKVTDMIDIAKAGVTMTPALAINGRVVSTGRIPTDDELAEMMEQ